MRGGAGARASGSSGAAAAGDEAAAVEGNSARVHALQGVLSREDGWLRVEMPLSWDAKYNHAAPGALKRECV